HVELAPLPIEPPPRREPAPSVEHARHRRRGVQAIPGRPEPFQPARRAYQAYADREALQRFVGERRKARRSRIEVCCRLLHQLVLFSRRGKKCKMCQTEPYAAADGRRAGRTKRRRLRMTRPRAKLAQVAELVDAGDLKSPAARRAGSIPALGTLLARHGACCPENRHARRRKKAPG